ncbi:MAG: aminotransferase class I/II-fold pyridoxal phosphate-dependent enzyme [Gammaproteobacteria bacterium]|nr:aminotransferase class I/II-fold pyridoxal phosphate-dependent enzyme [Gammaproteobacteria bacterium]
MYVQAHELFKRFLAGFEKQPEASIVHSLAESPKLSDFIDALDPNMSLDWSARDFQGLPELRQKILHRTNTAGVCQLENVLVTAGTAEANFLCLSQLVQPHDELIVDVPGWPQPLVLGEAIGAKVKTLTRDENRSWQIDLNQLSDLISNRTKLIFICNPNNPTGQILQKNELEEIIRLADKVGAYVLCDEVYAGLEWNTDELPRVANMYERGISTGSVSKVLGLQGLRLGWLICRDKQLVFDAMVLREDTSEIMNVMGEAIANVALDDPYYDRAIRKARQAGLHNLALLDEFIKNRAELEWQKPAAGLIGFCRLHMNIDSSHLAEQLIKSPYRTFVMPGSAYGYPQYLRLGFGGKADNALEDGLRRLQSCLDKLSKYQ